MLNQINSYKHKKALEQICDLPDEDHNNSISCTISIFSARRNVTPKFILNKNNIQNITKKLKSGKNKFFKFGRSLQETKETAKIKTGAIKNSTKKDLSLNKNTLEPSKFKVKIEKKNNQQLLIIGPKISLRNDLSPKIDFEDLIEEEIGFEELEDSYEESVNFEGKKKGLIKKRSRYELNQKMKTTNNLEIPSKISNFALSKSKSVMHPTNERSLSRKACFELPSAIDGPNSINPSRVSFNETVKVIKYYAPRSKSRRKVSREKRSQRNIRKKHKLKRKVSGWVKVQKNE